MGDLILSLFHSRYDGPCLFIFLINVFCRRTCKIVRVVSPSVGSDSGCIVIDDDEEDDAG